eukprot:scaffold5880_cov32-Tisochrysis_lutea.AAC.5
MSCIHLIIAFNLDLGCDLLEFLQQCLGAHAPPVQRNVDLSLFACGSKLYRASLQVALEPPPAATVLLCKLTNALHGIGAHGQYGPSAAAVRIRQTNTWAVAGNRQLGQLDGAFLLPRLVTSEGVLVPGILAQSWQLVTRWHRPLGGLDSLSSRLRLSSKAAEQLLVCLDLLGEQRIANLERSEAHLKRGAPRLDGITDRPTDALLERRHLHLIGCELCKPVQ